MIDIVSRLERLKDDRGSMAALRGVLRSPGVMSRHRLIAYTPLNRMGIGLGDIQAAVVSALYATHPENCTSGNFGYTCKQILLERDGTPTENTPTPVERRFMILVSSDGWDLYRRIHSMVTMAKSLGIKINYQELYKDLHWWNDRAKMEWSSSFWSFTKVEDES